MIKSFFFVLFFLGALSISGQLKIIVYDSDIRTPMEEAEVYCQDKLLGKTNAFGELYFKTECSEIKIIKQGYRTENVVVDKVMQKSLFPEKEEKEIDWKLREKSDKAALKILDKVLDNFENNSPRSLSSFRYKSYEKLSIDINPDSISIYNQSLEEAVGTLDKMRWLRKKKKPDTTLTVQKVFANSKLFLWERVFEHLYSKKYGEKKKILSNSMVGLKEPLNELLLIHSNRDGSIPKEILKENRTIYRYFLTDSIEVDGRKNFVIHFREITYRKSVQKRLYNGYFYIDAETFGIKKMESNGKTPDEYRLTSIWNLKDGKWFLDSETLKTKIYSVKIEPDDNDKERLKKFKLFGFVTVKYYDIEPNTDIHRKEYGGYYYQPISELEPMEKFRTEPLSLREQNSFTVLTELSKKYKLEKKLNGVASLFDGYFRTGIVDWSLLKIINYNEYEGIRLGTGIKLNETLHPKIISDYYFAYGLKDRKMKYGVGINYALNTKKTSFFRAEYTDDVYGAGRFNEYLWDAIMTMSNANAAMNNRYLYNAKSMKINYQYDPSNELSLRFSVMNNRESLVVPYSFDGIGNDFRLINTVFTLKYAPFFKNVMTPRGKFTIEKRYPELYLNYEKSWNILGGDFSYSRADFLLNHYHKSKWGDTGFRIYGGKLFGKAPLWQNFSANGLSSGSGINFALFSYLGFATMPSGRYYNDEFVGLYFMHTLPWHFKSIGQNTSSFSLVHRSVIGNMKNPQLHNVEFEPLNKLYQEIGIEWNNFLSSWFNLGVFYRVGHYNTPVFSENIGFLFKFRLLGF